MAITATWTEERRERVGRQTHITGYFTLTGSATAGGFAITASTFGLSRLDNFVPSGIAMAASGATTGMGASYDKTAGTVTLWEGGATANDNPFDESDLGSTTGYIIRGRAEGAG